jgi:ethanolamine kinase
MAVPFLPITFDNNDADKSALDLAYAFNPTWKESEGEVEIVRFTDGITNTLSKATKKLPGKSESENDDGAVLMRAYGNGTEVLINRDREMRAHSLLASMGLAPPLLARFENGLMYRFVQGDVCTPEDLRKPEVYRAVAKLLGQWHGSLPISAITSTPDLDDDAQRKHCGLENGKHTRPMPNIWSVMQQWIDALPNNTKEEKERNKVLNTELAELSARFGETPGLDGKDYIFSHCDLLSGNVIMQKPSGVDASGSSRKDMPVSFIDYEYSTPGPAAFDISNHFAEWAGFDCEHEFVPTKSQRRDFLRYYVGSFRYHSISDDDTMAIDINFQADIDQLYNQIEDFRGVPGFYWGIWALIQAMISQIDFDYPTYAEKRLGEYWAWKAESDGSRKREGKEMPVRERRWAEK